MRRRSEMVVWLALVACSTENRAPEIVSLPSQNATVYAAYAADVTCTDPEAKPLVLSVGEGDQCGGLLVDHGDGTASYAFTPEADQEGSCALQVVCTDGALEATAETEVAIGPPTDLLALTFGAPAPWATPIQDYIDINTEILGHEAFAHTIYDLTTFDEKLFFGYGDGTLNLGQNTPIELRYFGSPEPDAWVAAFVTDDEQISRYRVEGDWLLVAGPDDATEYDDEGNVVLAGNVYSMVPDQPWLMTETLSWGWHVHDIVRIGDTLYASGSGGTLDDYDASAVKGMLWRSDDGGTTFVVDTELPHPDPPGDQRLTNLLVVDEVLYAFGYYSTQDGAYGIAYRRPEEGGLEAWASMPSFFVTDSFAISESMGLLLGVDLWGTVEWAGLLVTADGAVDAEALEDVSVLNAEPLAGERTLLLYLAGDEYPGPDEGPWTFHVGVMTAGADLVELFSAESDAIPRSVAFWRRSLYVGMDDGTVWRADGTE